MADPPSVLTLLVKKGPCEGKALQRRAGAAALRVGRVAKGNDLSVGDAGASQRHLSVEFLPPPAGRWAVTDLGSSNGTVLNGTPLVATIPAPLSDGDLIKIGETTMLAVSISTDAGPGPGPAATRRSARNAAVAAAEAEEQVPAVPRRAGRRKAAAAEVPEAGNEVEKEPALPARRGGRKKAGAAEAPEAGNEVEEEPALPARRGGRKKAGAAEAPDAGNEAEEAAHPTRRGGRKKTGAAEAPEAGNEVEEESALPSRRGGRKKAVEPAGVGAEAEAEEEAAIPRRGRLKKAAAAVVLPPQPQNTRSTRASARRGEVLGCENDEGEVVKTGRGRGRVTWASPEAEDEGELAVASDLEGTAAEGKGEVVPAAGRGRGRRGRGRGRGKGRATRASTRKVEDATVENDDNEPEERDVADGRERVGSPLGVLSVNDPSKEDKVATEDDKLDANSKAYVEDEKMVDVEEDATLTEGAIEGRVNAQHAPADNGGVEEEEVKNLSKGGEIAVDESTEKVSPGSKLDGVGEVEKSDKREAAGASGEKGHEGENTGKRRLEDMTLAEWFVQIEKFLLLKNKQASEKAIAEVREKHQRFCEHVKSLKLNKSPAP